MISPDDDKIRDYFAAVLPSDAAGRLHAALGTGIRRAPTGKVDHAAFTPISFLWPDESDRAIDWIARKAACGDVWACPYLMHDNSEGRTKGNAAGYRLVHADVDHNDIDLDEVAKLGCFAVGSGTGRHAHVYGKLRWPIRQAQHGILCKGLIARFRGDSAKFSDNDLLRPAGTLNWKSTLDGGTSTMVDFL
jgi:hypothetical protein